MRPVRALATAAILALALAGCESATQPAIVAKAGPVSSSPPTRTLARPTPSPTMTVWPTPTVWKAPPTLRGAGRASSHPTRTASPTPGRTRPVIAHSGVAFYADSLGFLTDTWIRTRISTVYSHTMAGTALCDWLPYLPAQLASEHPRTVLLAFGGNNGTACMRPGGRLLSGQSLTAKYVHDATTAIRIIRASGAQPILVKAPVGDSRWQALNMVGDRNIINGWTGQSGATVIDGGRYVAPGQQYTFRLDGEQVRQPDGLHLTVRGASVYAQAICDGLGVA